MLDDSYKYCTGMEPLQECLSGGARTFCLLLHQQHPVVTGMHMGQTFQLSSRNPARGALSCTCRQAGVEGFVSQHL